MSLSTALENMSDADLKTMALFQVLLDTDSVTSIKDDSGNRYHVLDKGSGVMAACESSKPGIKRANARDIDYLRDFFTEMPSGIERARRIEELYNNILGQMITEQMMTMTIGASPSPKRETDNTELDFFTEMPSGGNEQSKLCGENFFFISAPPSQ